MSTGYTRQSAATIITGNTIQASDFNNEYNKIQDFADGTSGHDHSGGTGLGPKLSLTAAVSGILPTSNGGTGVANNASSTITITGAYGLTVTLSNTTAVTLPASGTLSTLAGSETFTNKTLTSPILVTPTLGVATATSINGLTVTSSTGTLTITNLKTLAASNSLTLAGTDGTTLTFQGTDTYVGRGTTDTLTNKTLTSPTLTTPSLGAATATTINGLTIGATTGGILSVSNNKTFSVTNSIAFAGTDSTTITFQATDTYIGRTTTDTLQNKTINSNSNTIQWGGVSLSISGAAAGDVVVSNGTNWVNSAASNTGVKAAAFIPNGSTVPTDVGMYKPASNTLGFYTNGGINFAVMNSSSGAVNYVTAEGAGAGFFPTMFAAGSDTNPGINWATKGTGGHFFNTNGDGAGNSGTNQFAVLHTASATRYITVTGSNGGAPTITTSAGDLAINSSSGIIQFANANSFAANGTATITISNLGPAGITTATIKKWLTFKDSSGTTLYVPAWGA